MNVEHLLSMAETLADQGRKPRSTDLRRAVSNTYYAVFHALAQVAADSIVGASKRQSEAWRRVYRAIDHGKAKDEFKNQALQKIDPSLALFAVTFVDLQAVRHTADYDPAPFRRSKAEVRKLIADARLAIQALRNLPDERVSDLSTVVLLKSRR